MQAPGEEDSDGGMKYVTNSLVGECYPLIDERWFPQEINQLGKIQSWDIDLYPLYVFSSQTLSGMDHQSKGFD